MPLIVKKLLVLICLGEVLDVHSQGVLTTSLPEDNSIDIVGDYNIDDTGNITVVIHKGGGGGGHGGGGGGGHGGGGGRSGGESRGGGSEGGAPTRGSGGSPPRTGASPGGSGNRQKTYPQLPGQSLGSTFPTRGRIRGTPPELTEEDKKVAKSKAMVLALTFLYAANFFIHEHNPCDGFQEKLTSRKNRSRKKGCRKEANRLKKAVGQKRSANCQDIAEGRCFQFSEIPGRCYVRVNANTGDGQWVLVDDCRAIDAPPPTPISDTSQPQPAPQPAAVPQLAPVPAPVPAPVSVPVPSQSQLQIQT